MTWIESHTTLRTSKKLKDLCDLLKINRAQAIGHLHMLWWWTIENREDGDLSGLFEHDIATACDWSGDPAYLLVALNKTGWIENNAINDWNDYSWRLLKMREGNRLRQQRHRDNRDVTRDVMCYVPPATIPDSTLPKDKRKRVSSEDFITSLKTNPAYKHLDIDTELGKMDAWILAHPGRRKTDRFILGWLNRIPKVEVKSNGRESRPFPKDTP